jgi:hypothetical protein
VPLTDDLDFQPNPVPLTRARVNASSIVTGPQGFVPGPIKADLSKTTAYAVLNEAGPYASKINAYVVLGPNAVAEQATASDAPDRTYTPSLNDVPWFGANLPNGSIGTPPANKSQLSAALAGPNDTAAISRPLGLSGNPWFEAVLPNASIAVPRVNSGSTRLFGALSGPNGADTFPPSAPPSSNPWIESSRSAEIPHDARAAGRLTAALSGPGGSDGSGAGIVAADPEQLSKLVNYAVLAEAGPYASKLNAYAVLISNDVDERADATDATDALYSIIIDPGPVEVASARDVTNASFLASGTVGPVRASQVVMEVLLPVTETARIRPFLWVNT